MALMRSGFSSKSSPGPHPDPSDPPSEMHDEDSKVRRDDPPGSWQVGQPCNGEKGRTGVSG